MRIENYSEWDTKALKDLFAECIRRDNKDEGKTSYLKSIPRKLVVIVKGCRGRRKHTEYIHGLAVIAGFKIWMYLPSQKQREHNKYDEKGRVVLVDKNLPMQLVVGVFNHELQHIRGYRHGFFSNNYKLEWPKLWPTVPISTPIRKEKVDRKFVNYQKTCKMVELKEKQLNKAESAVKRIKKALKKYEWKKKRYEKLLPIAASKQEVGGKQDV